MYGDEENVAVCQSCGVGTFQDTLGQTSCTKCDPGTISFLTFFIIIYIF
jgi:predicted Zn-ribbon and HTH transcriptional regulator